MSTSRISKLRSAAIGSALGLTLLEAGAAWMEHSTYFAERRSFGAGGRHVLGFTRQFGKS